MATVVLLHAFPLSSAMWAPQIRALQPQHHVLAPDFRGFGGAPVPAGEPAPPSLDVLADDVAAVLDAARLDRVVVGGLSMGGYVTMAFLRRHPQRVAGVILADTKPGADPDQARANRLRIADTLDTEGTPRVLVDDVLPGLLGRTTQDGRPDVVAHVRSLVEACSPRAAAWAQRAMAARPDSLPTLRAVRVPTLVLRGEEDALSSAEDTQAMVDAVPGARFVNVPGAGHISNLEQPEVVTTALQEFLAQV